MPPWVIATILVTLFVVVDTIVVWAILRACGEMLKQLGAGHPAVEPEAGAVRKEFQSFKIGLMNMGYSIHVTVDASYLHLDPSLTARWIGMPRMSIPWSEVRLVRRGRFGTQVKIGRQTVYGPRWCLELATA
ncbi:MAG: hypothetical protein KF902_14500 [Phycisphaeraceae bacterium]|nr:hypothetical protein [Phycisphaeraceae bacterium]